MKAQNLELRNIYPGENSREVNTASEKFKRLLESIKNIGVQVPLLVRPAKAGYQVVDGGRRYAAAGLAKVNDVPCIIYDGLEDFEAFKKTFFANFGRQDLTVIEEAGAVKTMMEKNKGDVGAVAKVMGWTPLKVRLRANLLALSKQWTAWAVLHGEGCAGHLDEIARLPVKIQDELFGRWSHKIENTGLKEFKKFLNENMVLNLGAAPWDLKDEKLVPKAGSCENCPKRSDRTQGQLFEEEGGKSGAKCLDGNCYRSKAVALTASRLDEVRKEYPTAVVGTFGSQYQAEQVFKPLKIEVEGLYQGSKLVSAIPKGQDKKYQPLLIVDGPMAGKLRFKKLGSYEVEQTKAKLEKAAKKKGASLEEKRNGLEKRRLALVAEWAQNQFEKPGDVLEKNFAGFVKIIFAYAVGLWGKDLAIVLRGSKADLFKDMGIIGSFGGYLRSAIRRILNAEIEERNFDTVRWILTQMIGLEGEEGAAILMNAAILEIPEPKSWTIGKIKKEGGKHGE